MPACCRREKNAFSIATQAKNKVFFDFSPIRPISVTSSQCPIGTMFLQNQKSGLLSGGGGRNLRPPRATRV
jgi:hypothetical protein